jgi:hypothetical protein
MNRSNASDGEGLQLTPGLNSSGEAVLVAVMLAGSGYVTGQTINVNGVYYMI